MGTLPPPRSQLIMENMESVAASLFPKHQAVTFARDNNATFIDFSSDELREASSKLKSNKAPGPINIPPEILKVVVEKNGLANEGCFPVEWKIARFATQKTRKT